MSLFGTISKDTPGVPADMSALLAELEVSSMDEQEGGCPSVISSTDQLLPIGKGGGVGRDKAIDSLEAICSVLPLLWSSCVAGLSGVRLLTAKKKSASLCQVLLWDCFKLSTSMLTVVDDTLTHAQDFQALACALDLHSKGEGCLTIEDLREDIGEERCVFRAAVVSQLSRALYLGLTLRACKTAWRGSLLMGCAMELAGVETGREAGMAAGGSLVHPVPLRCVCMNRVQVVMGCD